MPDFRVFCAPPPEGQPTLVLDPDESHHLVTVNRAHAGSPVVAFDGQGTQWRCILEGADRRAARLRIETRARSTPLPCRITLAQAVPLGPVMDAIIRKATEIGAARIVPVESERTQLRLDGDRQDRKAAKWRTAALEAAKQCGNPWLPRIDPIRPLADFLHAPDDPPTAEGAGLRLIASLRTDALPLKQVLARHPACADVTWLIGPEGDFTAGETALAVARGFIPVTLGPLVLRCDTAATYALSVTSYEFATDSTPR